MFFYFFAVVYLSTEHEQEAIFIDSVIKYSKAGVLSILFKIRANKLNENLGSGLKPELVVVNGSAPGISKPVYGLFEVCTLDEHKIVLIRLNIDLSGLSSIENVNLSYLDGFFLDFRNSIIPTSLNFTPITTPYVFDGVNMLKHEFSLDKNYSGWLSVYLNKICYDSEFAVKEIELEKNKITWIISEIQGKYDLTIILYDEGLNFYEIDLNDQSYYCFRQKSVV